MIAIAHPRLRSRTLILVGCAAVLAWLVITRSVAAYLADAAPQAALWLSPRQPLALLNLADRSLNPPMAALSSTPADADHAADALPAGGVETTSTSRQAAGSADAAVPMPTDSQNLADAFATLGTDRSVDLDMVRDRAVSALSRDPLNARALRILGQVGAAAKDDANAMKFMQAAAGLSLHETIAVYWLMRRNAAVGDYKAAIAEADALLRINPRLAPYVVPVLARFADTKASNGSVEAVLAENPPWRDVFFNLLPQSLTDARTPLTLLLALKKTATPPTSQDVNVYLGFLIRYKFYDLAYYTWLQFLPLDALRSAGALFNGSFESPPSGMPFDWTITQGSGVSIDIVPRPDDGTRHALAIQFLFGRVDYHSVYEFVVLPPGTYRFDGQYTGKVVGPRGLKWRVLCTNETLIGESEMITGAVQNWRKTSFSFTVPAKDCRAQRVTLDLDARIASERIVSGTVLFDELSITHVAAPPAAAAGSTSGAPAPAMPVSAAP